MTWDITVSIEPKALFKLLEATFIFFNHDILYVWLDISTETGSEPTPLFQKFIPRDYNLLENLRVLIAEYSLADVAKADILVEFVLEADGRPAENLPSFAIYVPQTGAGERCYLKFYRCDDFRGTVMLTGSRKLMDADQVLRFVKYICHQCYPWGLWLVSDDCDMIPWNYRLTFRRFCRFYIDDVKFILQPNLYSKKTESLPDSALRFGSRDPAQIQALKDFIEVSNHQFKRHGLPDLLTFDQFSSILINEDQSGLEETEQFGYFFIDKGVGIHAKSLWNGYCEIPYRRLIQYLAGSLSIDPAG